MKRPLLMALLVLATFRAAVADTPPCKSNELKRTHLPAFVGPRSRGGSGSSSELQIQERCIAWEAVVQPKADFGGAAVLRPGMAALLFAPNFKPATTLPRLQIPSPGDAPPTSESPLLLDFGSTPQRFSFKLSDFPSR